MTAHNTVPRKGQAEYKKRPKISFCRFCFEMVLFVCLFLPMASYSLARFPNLSLCKQKRTELRLPNAVLALHRSIVEHKLLFICKLSSAGVGTTEPHTVSNCTLKQGTTGSLRAPRLPGQIAKGLAALPSSVHWSSSALLPHFQLLLPMPTFAYKQENPSKCISTT